MSLTMSPRMPKKQRSRKRPLHIKGSTSHNLHRKEKLSQNQTPNKKKLSSLLDELRTTALDVNANLPSNRDFHETYHESAKTIVSLTKIIRLHPEFTNLSEPGKSHADFLVKWERIENYARRLGHM